MMPIVIQLQAPVSCILDHNFLPDGTADVRPGGAAVTGAHSAHMLRVEDAWLRKVVSGDPHLNVLVQCSNISIASTFQEMTELCAQAPHVCTLPGALHLPETDLRPLLIGDVSTMTLQQQIELYDWLDRFSESGQVVSVTSAPLWPLVERGRFVEGLFYRLNVVTLSAGPANH